MSYWKSGGWVKLLPMEFSLALSGLFCFGLLAGLVYGIIKALFL